MEPIWKEAVVDELEDDKKCGLDMRGRERKPAARSLVSVHKFETAKAQTQVEPVTAKLCCTARAF